MKKVLIIQKAIKHYRLSFYKNLYDILSKNDIELVVAYSQLNLKEVKSKNDNANLPSNYSVIVPSKTFISGKLVYQSVLPHIKGADLIIVEQANKNLVNYYLLALSIFNEKKIAYWGHGRNLQKSKNTLREVFKKFLLTTPSWWFAYTKHTQDYLVEQGYPKHNITNVNNSIDTKLLTDDISLLSKNEILDFKSKLSINYKSTIGLFCGSLYEGKLLLFLISACIEIRKNHPDFILLIIGDGPDRSIVERLCQENNWIKYLGAAFGIEKVKAFSISDVILNPGLVGLIVLDSFASGTPLITTESPSHGPEISYLESNINGIITKQDQNIYANEIISLLNDPVRLKKLSRQALVSSQKYTTEIMAANFAKGIMNSISDG